jgi:hypothetical protein
MSKSQSKREKSYCKYAHRAIVNSISRGRSKKATAEDLGVAVSTICKWIREDPALRADIENASNNSAIDAVEYAMFSAATGHRLKEIKVHFDMDTKQFYEHEIIKEYSPSVPAGQFILKNARPEKWKDKVTHEVTREDETVETLREAAEIFANDPVLIGNGEDDEAWQREFSELNYGENDESD